MKKLQTPGHHLCQESSVFLFPFPFSAHPTFPSLLLFMVRNTLLARAAVATKDVCRTVDTVRQS